MAKNKFLDLSGVSYFLNKCKALFAPISHSHNLDEITDYVVDTELSSTSTNPIQNLVISNALDVIKDENMDAINNLSATIDTKVDKIEGKGLSSNDFTDALFTKLNVIEANAEYNDIVSIKKNSEVLTIDADRSVNISVPVLHSVGSGIVDGNGEGSDVTYNSTISELKADVESNTSAIAELNERLNSLINGNEVAF